MIQADARSRFTSEDIALVEASLADALNATAEDARAFIERVGLDEVLDMEKVVSRLVAVPLPGPSISLLFYCLTRQALLRHGLTGRPLADYCAALLREFGGGRRAYRIASVDDHEHHYVVDILQDLSSSQGVRHYRALVHLGNYSLWMGGLFPDRIAARQIRRGGPDLSYYEAMGHRGYAGASDHALADRAGLADIFRQVADRFGEVRHAMTEVGTRLTLRAA